MSGRVFSETLQSITIAKTQKEALSLKLENELDPRKKLQLLLDGVKQCLSINESVTIKRTRDNGTKPSSIELLVKNLEKFIVQAEYDPSISDKNLEQWENYILRQIDIQSSKYQYATLYSELVKDWRSGEQQKKAAEAANDTSEIDKEFQKIKESVARTEGRANLIFEPFETDRNAIATYLNCLFGVYGDEGQPRKALNALRKQFKAFENDLSAPGQFNPAVLRWTINGVISSGVLSEEKGAALKDFLSKTVRHTAVADVLNMRLASIDKWEWNSDLVNEQRRHLKGRDHTFIDEDLLEALLLQYIGVKWAVFIKKAFTDFSKFDGAWSPLNVPITPIDEARRRLHLLQRRSYRPSVQQKREELYKSIYFMSGLPNSEEDNQADEDGFEEAAFDSLGFGNPSPARSMRQQVPGHMKRQTQPSRFTPSSFTQSYKPQLSQPVPPKRKKFSVDGLQDIDFDSFLDRDSDDVDKLPKTPMEIKQFLLHLLSTEIIINKKLHGDFTCARSEFESFFPSLPHSTILSVLKFFGLSVFGPSGKWLRFFQKFLEAPLKFNDDGISSEARVRKRGVPGVHALSSVCGEVVLFCLDYAVNQSTDGVQLYRMNDEFWIWSPSHQTVAKGWQFILEFSRVMGVTLNRGKTGSIRITSSLLNQPMDPSLPTGDIRWGFLKLDPVTGRFIIDQYMVNQHVSELQSQLRDTKSIFSWIQAWNTYTDRFFTSNFGKPANSLGRGHVDAMLSSFRHIQNLIFRDTNLVSYLKDRLRERFGIDDVPDGYLYFPTTLGGLELHNPFIGLLQLRDRVYEEPEKAMENFFETEKEAYKFHKFVFESLTIEEKVIYAQLLQVQLTCPRGSDLQTFMSFEEFSRYRELNADEGTSLSEPFENLLKQPSNETADWDEWDIIVAEAIEGGSSAAFDGRDMGYWKWVFKLYGEEMKERFGGLAVVDKWLLLERLNGRVSLGVY